MIDLHDWAMKNSYKVAWGNSRCLSGAFEQMETLSCAGELNELQNTRLSQWRSYDKYKIPKSKRNTVVLVAYSTSGKTRRIIFDFAGKQMTFVFPPGYAEGGEMQQSETLIEERLAGYLSGYGYKVERLAGPYKTLAVKIGLGKYGRNNLIYVNGFGSYIRLVGFVTDAIIAPEHYYGVTKGKLTLETCCYCNLCQKNCPTHAIGKDRFLLHVDRCLSYQNEQPDQSLDFAHSAKNECLVGCLMCQTVCPHNKQFTEVGITVSQHFNAAETDYVFGGSGESMAAIEESVYEKMAKLGLARHKEYIVRNIRGVAEQISESARNCIDTV